MASSPSLPPTQPRSDYADFAIASASGLILSIGTIFFVAVLFSGKLAGSRDYVSYWSTGVQLRRHADPYNWQQMLDLQNNAAHLGAKGVLFMRNLPWALPLVYPLGFLDLKIGAFIWNILLLGCLLISVHLVRVMHGSPNNYVHWLGVAFTPAIICLNMGQTGLFALLGLVLFLRLYHTHPYLAGLSLWLCALKPQLFLPFGVALLAWIVVSRSYRIAAGAAFSLIASTALAWWIDPQAWPRYFDLMRSQPVKAEFVPCLSDAIRFWIRPQSTWIQFVPVALGCIWALYYFWRRRNSWDWLEHGSLLVLVSLVVAPYCFAYDLCVAIPAILHGLYNTRSRPLIAFLAVVLLIVQFEVWNVRVITGYFMWLAPTLLIWYLLANASARDEAVLPAPVPA
jgi:hypothetical protein